MPALTDRQGGWLAGSPVRGESLAESLPTARLLLLVNYRPEYEHGWGRKTYYRQLRLDPLAPERSMIRTASPCARKGLGLRIGSSS